MKTLNLTARRARQIRKRSRKIGVNHDGSGFFLSQIFGASDEDAPIILAVAHDHRCLKWILGADRMAIENSRAASV